MNTPDRASSDYPQPEKNVADHGTETVLPAIKARQGINIRGMMYVLVIGTALAIVGLAAVYLGFFASI
jgi:hypothetical protein